MFPLELVLIALVLGLWSFLIIFLDKRKVLERHNMSRIWGIFLMWRTRRGRDLIDRLSRPKRFWNRFAIVGLYVLFLGMASMFLLILASTLTVIFFGFAGTVSAKEVFVLPGLNPYVPLVYGLIALIFAVVVHELSHGILTRANDMEVKYLGLLFLLVPVGAFMEPNEEQVKATSRLKRIKMYAAGPIINFIFAFVFFILFSTVMMGSVSAPNDPFVVTDIFEGSSLECSTDGFESLYEINGTKITTMDDMYVYDGADPGSWISVRIKDGNDLHNVPAIAGVMIYSVTDGSPAESSGIEEGSIILSMDGRTVRSREMLTDLLDGTRAGQNMTLELLVPPKDGSGRIVVNRTVPPWLAPSLTSGADALFPEYELTRVEATLDDKFEHIHINTFKGKGFLGIGSAYLGIGGVGGSELLERIKDPISSADSIPEGLSNLMYMTFSLPLSTSIVPFHDPLVSVYEVEGPLSILPEDVFWFLANCLFYLFWLNILLALFNALPAYPLDGGVIFKDSLVLIGIHFRGKRDIEKMDKIAGRIAATSSLIVFGLILVTWLYPYLRLAIGGF